MKEGAEYVALIASLDVFRSVELKEGGGERGGGVYCIHVHLSVVPFLLCGDCFRL